MMTKRVEHCFLCDNILTTFANDPSTTIMNIIEDGNILCDFCYDDKDYKFKIEEKVLVNV
jgi:hypothetical protein